MFYIFTRLTRSPKITQQTIHQLPTGHIWSISSCISTFPGSGSVGVVMIKLKANLSSTGAGLPTGTEVGHTTVKYLWDNDRICSWYGYFMAKTVINHDFNNGLVLLGNLRPKMKISWKYWYFFQFKISLCWKSRFYQIHIVSMSKCKVWIKTLVTIKASIFAVISVGILPTFYSVLFPLVIVTLRPKLNKKLIGHISIISFEDFHLLKKVIKFSYFVTNFYPFFNYVVLHTSV